MRIQLKRSSALENGRAKEPSQSQLEYGEIAVNFNDVDPAIFFKDSTNAIVRVTGDGAIGSGNAEIEFTSGPGLYITNPVFTLDQQVDQTIDVEIVLDSDAERVGLETVTDTTLSGGYLRAKTATPNEKGVMKEPDGGVGVYMRQVTASGYEWVSKNATISLPPGYPNLSDGDGNTLDNRYLNKNIDQTYTGTTLTISQNLTVGNQTNVNNLNASGTITGNVTGDLTGNADTADLADLATNATNANTAANLTRSVIAGDGLTGGGELNADRTLDVGAADATIIVEADGIRVDQNNLNFTAAAKNGQINISASNGLTASGNNATANQSGNTTRTISGINATTSAKGVVKLNDSVASTSTTEAATANAARKAYNRAAEYAPSKTGANASGTWNIDISGNAATADVAAFVSGNVATADLATNANNVRVDNSTGNANRPFIFAAGIGSSGDYIRLYKDNATTCFINPSSNTIGATNFTSTNVTASNLITTPQITTPRIAADGNITIQPNGTTQGRSVAIYPGIDDDGVAGNIIIGVGNTTGNGGHIYFRGNGGSDQFRFAKSGQQNIEGFLSFESLSTDRTFTFPNANITLAGTNVNNSFSIRQNFTAGINCDTYTGRGQEVTINAGESESKFSSQTAEIIYLNAENGVRVCTPSVANFGSGYVEQRTNITGAGIYFHRNTTAMGEITTSDATWLRINQNTNKNIYTPRYIRADAGFFVDGTAKGINGSGNFIGGTIAGASDYGTLLRSNANDSASGTLTFNGRVNIRGGLDLSDGQYMYWGSSDDINIHYNSNNWMYWNFKTGNGIIFQDNGANKIRLEDSGIFRPESNNTGTIGTSSVYWNNVYATSITAKSGSIKINGGNIVQEGTGYYTNSGTTPGQGYADRKTCRSGYSHTGYDSGCFPVAGTNEVNCFQAKPLWNSLTSGGSVTKVYGFRVNTACGPSGSQYSKVAATSGLHVALSNLSGRRIRQIECTGNAASDIPAITTRGVSFVTPEYFNSQSLGDDDNGIAIARTAEDLHVQDTAESVGTGIYMNEAGSICFARDGECVLELGDGQVIGNLLDKLEVMESRIQQLENAT